MKKLLIFMLVLGLASMASAVLVPPQPMELRVAGGGTLAAPTGPPSQVDYYDPVESELVLAPSDLLWIGVYNPVDGDTALGMQKGTYALGMTMGGDTVWTGNWATYIPPLAGPVPDNEYWGATDTGPTGIVDLWALFLTDGNPATVNLTGVLDAKELHCLEGYSEEIVYLFDLGGGGILLDQILIHQIPEPMTIVLLGLGGLFLRRRR